MCGGCAEVEVTWEQLTELCRYGHGETPVRWMRQSAVSVLGPFLGAFVVSEIDAGRMPRLRPVRK